MQYAITIKDRSTGKKSVVRIEAGSRKEAIQIAKRDYGVAYEIVSQ